MVIDKAELRWFYAIILAFLAVSIFFLAKEMYWVAAFPLVLGIAYLAVFSIDTLLFIVAFCTPVAIVLNDKTSGPALSIPTEPLMFGITLLFIFKFIFEGGFDKRILWHPVSLAIFFHITWMLITSMTSSMPLVSFKHLMSQLWFIIPFYFLGTQLFRKKENIRKFVWLYAITLAVVILYTIFNHAQNGWTQKAAHWVMTPFYNDHTAYAAVIALFIPIIFAFTRNREASFPERVFAILMLTLFLTALILSYTRAAWLSLVIAITVYFIYKFKIRFYTVAAVSGAILVLFFSFQTEIMMKLEKNRQDSATDFNKHLQSISNISTDASNLERINRWNCAMRMFDQRPFLGWGPGTYQFNYAPFQKSNEMTIISTNAGDMGNAHSEFIGPLAEEGVLGMVAMILIVIAVIYRATMFYSISSDKQNKILLLGILLGLVTYFVHGTLNNFLDTDKLSVPVWAFIAMIVALDVYHSNSVEDEASPRNGKKKLLH
ncbi:MAG TPA: O-antigen ligase family protein [Bacteroidia bacterium]|nr:O-antigen ligase family protein [Bacteroidia bacterium]